MRMRDTDHAKPAGIKDIAEALGVSIGTVDRALHSRGGVSAKTRDRVLQTARDLSYTPNLSARNLKLNRHVRIAVFLPVQILSFFNAMREGIRSAARSQGDASVEVVFFDYPRLAEGDIEAIEAADWKSFQGVILAPGSSNRLAAICRTASDLGKPLVFVATDAPRLPRLASIAADALTSGGIAAELLGRFIKGRGSVAIFTGSLAIHDHAEKLRGFAGSLAMLSPHLTLLPAIESHESAEDAYKAAQELLSTTPDLCGVYVSTANSSPVLSALNESGRTEIVVITTDLFPELSSLIEGGLVSASLYQRPFTQGRLAFEALAGFLLKGEAPRRTTRLAPHIVLRSNVSLFANEMDVEENPA